MKLKLTEKKIEEVESLGSNSQKDLDSLLWQLHEKLMSIPEYDIKITPAQLLQYVESSPEPGDDKMIENNFPGLTVEPDGNYILGNVYRYLNIYRT